MYTVFECFLLCTIIARTLIEYVLPAKMLQKQSKKHEVVQRDLPIVFSLEVFSQNCNARQSEVTTGICVSRHPAPTVALTPGASFCLMIPVPNMYFMSLALNLYLLAPVLNFCLPVLRFTVEFCYSYSVYLCKLRVYLYILIILSIM